MGLSLMENLELPHVVLASASPRRRDLLEQHGVEHSVHPASVDDGDLEPGHGADPASWVASLAFLKASSCVLELAARKGHEDAVVLGADTVCVQGAQIIGKPVDLDDARRIIHLMRDATHEVMTGVAIIRLCDGRRDVFVDRSTVRVGMIPDQDIELYLESDQWRGKAGAYNISERLDAGWDVDFEGCAFSIAGLPIERTIERIAAISR